ncbi:MAG: hypothetical protein IK136_02695 [Oscillospiraceae bacterium]|nr:hypothetical protein [Oscillospiraceae bacterium]
MIRLISLFAMLLGGLIAVNGCASGPVVPGPPETGGVVDNSTNAPKTITSTELTSCDFTYLLEYREMPMADGKREYPFGLYEFHIAEKDGKAECSMRFRGVYSPEAARDLAFTADRSALSGLEKVIRDAEVALSNGHDKVNTALGTSIRFSALYASGEKITIWAEGGASTIPDDFRPKPLFDWFTALAVENGQEWLQNVNKYGEPTDAYRPVGERAAGSYVLQSPDEEEGTVDAVDVYYVGGRLLCEVSTLYDGSLMSYYAMEIVPDEPGRFDGAIDQDEAVPVKVKRFSGFSNAGEYWDEPEGYELVLTDRQLLLESDDDWIILDRDGTYPAPHDAEAMKVSLRAQYGGGRELSDFVSAWEAKDGADSFYLLLRADGSLVFLHKEENRPIRAFVGACVLTEDGAAHCIAERIGWGEMPLSAELTLARTSHNELVLTETEPGTPLLGREELFLTPAAECCFGRLLP